MGIYRKCTHSFALVRRKGPCQCYYISRYSLSVGPLPQIWVKKLQRQENTVGYAFKLMHTVKSRPFAIDNTENSSNLGFHNGTETEASK